MGAGFGGLQGSAGRGWEKPGCPGARAVPAHPGCSISALPEPAGHGSAPRRHTGRARASTRSKVPPVPSAGAPGARWDPPSAGSALAVARAGQGQRAGSAARSIGGSCTLGVRLFIWSSDTRAGTQPRSLSAQTPKQLSQLPRLLVFPCNVSPGSLPMTRLLHIPSPGRAEGTAGTPRISRAR